MNSKEFVNNFNDYLRTDTKNSYNSKYLTEKNNVTSFDTIDYSKNYKNLLNNNYGNNLLIENNNIKFLSDTSKILDKNNYNKNSCHKSYTNKYTNSPFEYDTYFYLN